MTQQEDFYPFGLKFNSYSREHSVPNTIKLFQGQRQGSKGPYKQAREFDENGNPVRDIDHTDHGRPGQHPNPHQHK